MAGSINSTKVQVGTSASASQVLQALAAGIMPTADPMGAMQAEVHMRNGTDVASGLMLDGPSTQAFAQSVDAWLATGGLMPYQPPLALPPRQQAQLNRRLSAIIAQRKLMLPLANAPANPPDAGVPAKPVVREPSRDRLHAMARTDLSNWLAGLGENVIVKSDDLTPPKAVQAACQRGLNLAPEHGGEGLTSGAISRARSMAAGNAVSAETISRIAAFHARHTYAKQADPPSPGYVAALLWGGDAGKAWANAKSDTAKAGNKNLVGGDTGAAKTAENAARGKANPEAYKAAVYARITKKAMPMSDQILSKYLAKAEDGAGSRGGHIIGRTSSGKPIYASSHETYHATHAAMQSSESHADTDHEGVQAVHAAHPGWQRTEHLDAAEAHQKAASSMKAGSPERQQAHQAAQAHGLAAMSHGFGRLARQRTADHQARAEKSTIRRQDMTKAAQILHSYLSKAEGEGSRGGHVIGHTKSGKAIYETTGSGRSTSFHDDSKGYTRKDHMDAASAHRKRARDGEDGQLRRDTASRHEDVAEAMKERGVSGYLKGGTAQHKREAAHHELQASEHANAAKDAPNGSLQRQYETKQARKHADTARAHRSIAQSLKVGED